MKEWHDTTRDEMFRLNEGTHFFPGVRFPPVLWCVGGGFSVALTPLTSTTSTSLTFVVLFIVHAVYSRVLVTVSKILQDVNEELDRRVSIICN